LLLTIRDDGGGFDVRHTKGLGLLGIQERVTRLGGACQVRSEPGAGATLSVELPFDESTEQRRSSYI
jgi:signal transduction histidine kinase